MLKLKLKLQSWASWYKELTHQKRPWCWERLKAGEDRENRWVAWMESQTGWTWVRVNSRRWWRTGESGVLQFMGSRRVGHICATEKQVPPRHLLSSNHVEHLFLCLLAICLSSLEKCLSRFSVHILIVCCCCCVMWTACVFWRFSPYLSHHLNFFFFFLIP